ncbi:unnamed protein product [Allacma fusca]|uniref:Uncharacterized protein n=1 Tax=Allacma fusca TaxID=39272 RepID=A0A8J2PZW3_9HEXA|nr:unnamed protein product [Allacma fusca]CAG7834763.1 unnamed protein product [Allacma fusca]
MVDFRLPRTTGDWRRSGTPNGVGHQPNLSIARYSRRANHHQSTGSLHSADSQSSNGLSPSPSPSPYNRASPSPRNGGGIPLSPAQKNGGVGINGTPSPLAKRWSSTSDFSSNPSLFSQHSAMAASTKDATFNAEEGTIRIYLRGRPINLYLPNSLVENYSLSRVATAPLAKLRLEWVYPCFHTMSLMIVYECAAKIMLSILRLACTTIFCA